MSTFKILGGLVSDMSPRPYMRAYTVKQSCFVRSKNVDKINLEKVKFNQANNETGVVARCNCNQTERFIIYEKKQRKQR